MEIMYAPRYDDNLNVGDFYKIMDEFDYDSLVYKTPMGAIKSILDDQITDAENGDTVKPIDMNSFINVYEYVGHTPGKDKKEDRKDGHIYKVSWDTCGYHKYRYLGKISVGDILSGKTYNT